MNKKVLLVTGLILLAAASRLLPHPDNFSPLGGIALFAGAYFSRKWMSVLIPILAMVLSDALMGFPGAAYPDQLFTVYATFGIIALMGRLLQHNKSIFMIGGASIASSIVFFVITNFMVWASGFYATPFYPTTFEGLVDCYVKAIPFFNATLAGDLFYSGILFGGFYLISINVPQLVKE